MSEIKVNSIKGVGASAAAITVNNTDGTCTANVTNNLSNRNKIINGAMAVSQRGTSRTGTGGGSDYFLCDRWRIFSANTSARFTISQEQDTSGAPGLPYSFKFDCTTADTSLAASDFLGIQQKIEGQNVQDFLKGTSSAKKFTLSFYVKTNKSGVYTVELRDNNNSRQCSKTFTVSDGNWNRYTVSFPADTTGAFNNNNNDSLQVNWWLIAGSTYTGGTLNTSGWASQTNANRVSSSNVNIGDSTSNNFELTGVQLEVDHTGSGVATDFEHLSVAEELRRCQRYFAKYSSIGSNYAQFLLTTGYSTDTDSRGMFHFVVEMRAANPSFSYSGSSGNVSDFVDMGGKAINLFQITNDGTGKNTGIRCIFSGSNTSAGFSHVIRANNTANAFFAFDAEL